MINGESIAAHTNGSAKTNGAARRAIDVSQIDLPALTRRAIIELEIWNTPPTLFRQNGEPVRLEFDDFNRPIIKSISVPGMRLALAEAIKFFKVRHRERVDVEPPRTLVENVLATPRLPIPSLRGVATAPFFTAAGKLVVAHGYDADSQIYLALETGLIISRVPQEPTSAELADAVATIDDIFADFPFKGSADRAHTFAMLLLPFVREMIDGPTPLHLVNAPNAGTGKGLLSQAALMPACGDIAASPFGRDEAEQRKRITTLLVSGQPAVLLDNLAGRLDSPWLASALTTQWWADRLLGGHDSPVLANRATWVATSNNAKLSEEIARRTISIRIDAKVERPFERNPTWRHPQLLAFVRENRGSLIAAALTVVQAWIAASRPRMKRRPLGSYEAWSAVIGGTLAHAGIPGFLENVEELFAAADTTGEALRALVADWAAANGEESILAKDLLALALAAGVDLGHGEEPLKVSKLGKNVLLDNVDRVFGGYVIEKRSRSSRGQLWGLRRKPQTEETSEGCSEGCEGCDGSPSGIHENQKLQTRTERAPLTPLTPLTKSHDENDPFTREIAPPPVFPDQLAPQSTSPKPVFGGLEEPNSTRETPPLKEGDPSHHPRVSRPVGTGATLDSERLERVLRGVAGGMLLGALESRLGWGRERVLDAARDSKDVVPIGPARGGRYGLRSELELAAVDETGNAAPADTSWAPRRDVLIATVTWQPPGAPGSLAAIAEISDPESQPHYIIRAVEGMIVPPGASSLSFDRLVSYVFSEKLKHDRWYSPSAYQSRTRLWRIRTPRRCISICKCPAAGSAPNAACDCITPRTGGTCACARHDKPQPAPAGRRGSRRILVPGLHNLVCAPCPKSGNGPLPRLTRADSDPAADNA